MWVHGGTQEGYWDDGVMEIVGGNREEGRKIRGWLGDVDLTGGKRVGNVSQYLVDRYGLDPGMLVLLFWTQMDTDGFLETIVTQFTSDYLSTYLSLCPSPSDAVLSFGPMDVILTPAQHYIPTRLYSLFPHPAQDSSEK